MKKTLILTLALFTLSLFALVSCKSEEPHDHNCPGYPHWWYETVDCSGVSLTFAVDATPPAHEGVSAYRYMKGSDEENADAVLSTVYTQNEDTCSIFGITVEFVEYTGGPDGVQSYIEESVRAEGAETPDLFITDLSGTLRAAMGDSLYNVKSSSQDLPNYFDFSDEGWYTDYMNGLSLAPSSVYILAGHHFVDVLRQSHVMLFNRTAYETQSSSLSEIFFYEEIANGCFTYDTLTSVADLCWEPLPDDSRGYAQEDDVMIGFVGDHSSVSPLLFSNRAFPFAVDGELPYENGTLFTLADSIYILLTDSPFAYQSASRAETLSLFQSGRSVFTGGMMLSDLEALGNDPGFAYMPIVYPKASIEQSYSVFVDGSAAVGSIAACTKHFSALSAYLQYSAEIRDYALYQYFESVANCSFSKGQNKDVYESFSMIKDAIASPLNPLLLECLIENGTSEEPILPPRELLTEAIRDKENTFEQKHKQNHVAYAAAYAAVTRNK